MQKTLLLLTAALFLHLGAPKTHAAIEVSVDLFYDQLGDYGDWVEVGDYGYGWQPRDVDEDWRPYSDGRWAYTDAGWTWLSDEPYGWAVYHYGRWARLENRGWVWIPGTEWAPAWVSWRRSPQHVGWAPLPPEANFRRSVGFSGWVDSYYDIGPSAYRFVEVRDFGAPRMRSVFVEPRRNITIINQTTNITRITYVDSVVYNQGPRFEEISRESAEPIRRLKLDRRVEMEGDRNSFRGEKLRSRVDGDSLRVFAPQIDARAVEAPSRLSAKIEKVEVNRGWKDAGPAADVEKLRAKVRGAAEIPKELPPVPKFERLAEQTPSAEAKPAEDPTKDGRKPRDSARTPNRPAAEAQAAPSETPGAPATPMKPQRSATAEKAEKTEKAAEPESRAKPPTERPRGEQKPEQKPEKTMPRGEAPAPPDRQGKARQQPEQPPSRTSPPEEAPKKKERPEARKEAPPSPERSAPQTERSRPPEGAPRREAPEPPKNEARKPQTERPERAREVPPTAERGKPETGRGEPPKAARGNAPEPAPRGAAEKTKPAKEKGRDEKKLEGEAPKPE